MFLKIRSLTRSRYNFGRRAILPLRTRRVEARDGADIGAASIMVTGCGGRDAMTGIEQAGWSMTVMKCSAGEINFCGVCFEFAGASMSVLMFIRGLEYWGVGVSECLGFYRLLTVTMGY